MSFVLWLFEIGYILQHLATLFQAKRVYEKKSTELVSIETKVMFLIGALSRVIWMWDSMLKGFWLSYIEMILGLGSLGCFFYLFNYYRNRENWTPTKAMPFYYKLQFLIPLVFVLAFFFHPGTKGAYYFTMQMFVSLSIFSESIGLLPQLSLIRSEKETGNLSKFYVLFLAVARFFRLLFWVQMLFEGNKFISLIIADLIHCILIFQFIYSVWKNWNNNILPFAAESVDRPKKVF